MNKKIIFTADDFGCCDFIDDGIYAAIDAENINSISTFVTFPDSEKRIKNLLNLISGSRAKIGLHFSISAGQPLFTDAFTQYKHFETKTKNGKTENYFFSPIAYPYPDVKAEYLADELLAQLEKLDQILGHIKIDHVSVHHGISYLDEDFYKAYISAIKTYNPSKYPNPIPIRSPRSFFKLSGSFKLLNPKLPEVIKEGFRLGNVQKFGFAMRTNYKNNYAKKKGLKMPTCLIDTIYGCPTPSQVDHIFDFINNDIKQDDFSGEFMFHLGIGNINSFKTLLNDNFELYRGVNINYFENRILETNLITTYDFRNKLNQYNIKAITFKDL